MIALKQHYLVFVLIFFSISYAHGYLQDAVACPEEDQLNHYVEVPLFYDLKNMKAKTENISGFQNRIELHDKLRKTNKLKKIKIYYEMLKSFDPQKKTIFILPGGPGENHSMIHYHKTKTFWGGFNVIAMDHRGLGCSETRFPQSGDTPVTHPYSYLMRYAASDIEMIRRKHLGDKPMIVWGGSYGSILAETYALLYPDKVSKLFLSATLSSYKDLDFAQRNYEPFLLSSFPEIEKDYFNLKLNDPFYFQEFIYKSFRQLYGKPKSEKIPKMLSEIMGYLKGRLTKKDLDEKLKKKYPTSLPYLLPTMSLPILCIEMFDGRKNHPLELKLLAILEYCKKYEDIKNYVDYSEDLKNIEADTFIYSGLYDHITPYQVSQKVHKKIPNSFLYLDKYVGHSSVLNPCFKTFFQSFIQGASHEELEELQHSSECTSNPFEEEEETSVEEKEVIRETMLF